MTNAHGPQLIPVGSHLPYEPSADPKLIRPELVPTDDICCGKRSTVLVSDADEHWRVAAFTPDSRGIVVVRPGVSVSLYDISARSEATYAAMADIPVSISCLAGGTAVSMTLCHETRHRPSSLVLRWWIYPNGAILHEHQFSIVGFGLPQVADDGSLVALVVGNQIRMYDGRTAEFHGNLGEDFRSRVEALAVSCDGRRLPTGGLDKTVRLWDVPSRQELARWDFGVGTINDLAFSADGLMAAVAGSAKRPVVWDLDV